MSFECASEVPCDGKTRWPELLGKNQSEAIAAILKDNPSIQVFPLPPGGIPRGDYCCNRVWLYVDRVGGTVTRVPILG